MIEIITDISFGHSASINSLKVPKGGAFFLYLDVQQLIHWNYCGVFQELTDQHKKGEKTEVFRFAMVMAYPFLGLLGDAPHKWNYVSSPPSLPLIFNQFAANYVSIIFRFYGCCFKNSHVALWQAEKYSKSVASRTIQLPVRKVNGPHDQRLSPVLEASSKCW